jgi:hypothetical protein
MAGSAGKIPVLGHGSKFCNEKLYTYVWVRRQCFSMSQISIDSVAYMTASCVELVIKICCYMDEFCIVCETRGLLLLIVCEPNQIVTWKHTKCY